MKKFYFIFTIQFFALFIFNSKAKANSIFFEDDIFITADGNRVCPGATVEFSANYGYSSYSWDFDNGKTASGYSANTCFETAGTYNVSVLVKKSSGADTTIYYTVNVLENINISENIDYSNSNYLSCPLEGIIFNANKFNIKSVEWDFGDGNISRNFISYHSYFDPGRHPIQLKLVNWCGSDTIVKDTIEVVSSRPIEENINIYISSKTVCPGTIIRFNNYDDMDHEWDLGDQTKMYTDYFEHSYSQPGIYPITLKLSNKCGNSKTTYDTIVVTDNKKLSDIAINHADEACPGVTLSFSANADDIKSAKWDFGDGVIRNGVLAKHSFDDIGNHVVTVTLTNHCEIDTILTENVHIVNNHPIDSYYELILSESAYNNTLVDFDLLHADPNINNYVWNFGDGTSDTTDTYSTSHFYSDEGTYNVSLIINNACGLEKTFNDIITIKKRDKIDIQTFYISDNKVCPGEPVNFEIFGETILNYIWETGDGYTSRSRKFTHSYSEPGLYNISVTVSDAFGNDSVLYKEVLVDNNNLIEEVYFYCGDPSSISNSNDYYFCTNEKIDFAVYGGEYESVIWNFGDNNSSQAPVTNHIYASTGTYNVSVKATNRCGDELTSYFKVYITDNDIVTGTKFYSPESACPGENIYVFSYLATDSAIWDFGDGTSGKGRAAYHIYENPGEYKITLKIFNICGDTGANQKFIKVKDSYNFVEPYLNFPDIVCPNMAVQFDSYDCKSYLWDFGDGNVSDNSYNRHTYSNPGKYVVKLAYTGYCGDSGSVSKEILVSDNYKDSFSGIYLSSAPDKTCPGQKISFSIKDYNFELLNIASASWNFGDGNTTSQLFPDHVYNTSGKYDVSAELTNECGNTATFYTTVDIGGESSSETFDISVREENCLYDTVYVYFWLPGQSYSIDFGDGTTVNTVNSVNIGGEILNFATHKYSSTGVYDVTVEVTNSCGQIYKGVKSIYIGNQAGVSSSMIIERLCNNIASEFVAYGANSYEWNFGDATETVLSSGSFSKVSHLFSSPGIYSMTVTGINTCGQRRTSYWEIEIDSSCTISSNSNYQTGIDNVIIYPNPAGDKIFIKTNNMPQNSYIEVYNLLGKIVLTEDIRAIHQSVDISNLEKGLYVIKVITGNESYIKKIIKE